MLFWTMRVGSCPIDSSSRKSHTGDAERGRCHHVSPKQIGQNGPDSPKHWERWRKANARIDPLHTRAAECGFPSNQSVDGAPVRKSGINRFPRHCRLDPPSTVQRAPGYRTPAFSIIWSSKLPAELGNELRSRRELPEVGDHVGAQCGGGAELSQHCRHLTAMVRGMVHHVSHHLPQR
jgi:hypothetical protein